MLARSTNLRMLITCKNNKSSPFLTTRKFVVFTVRCPTPANKNPVTVSCQPIDDNPRQMMRHSSVQGQHGNSAWVTEVNTDT